MASPRNRSTGQVELSFLPLLQEGFGGPEQEGLWHKMALLLTHEAGDHMPTASFSQSDCIPGVWATFLLGFSGGACIVAP